MQQAYQLTKSEAASMISLVFIGLGLGSPLLAIIAEKWSNKINVILFSTLLACVSLGAVLYSQDIPHWLLGTSLFVFGFALGAYLLVFSLGVEANSATVTATVIALINAGDSILTGITEPLIGKILDLTWTGRIVEGAPSFTLAGYYKALTILPIYLLVAASIILFIKYKSANTKTQKPYINKQKIEFVPV